MSSPDVNTPTSKSPETPVSSQQTIVHASESDKTCVVCFKIVDIFSIGECDHPVCYECSTSMDLPPHHIMKYTLKNAIFSTKFSHFVCDFRNASTLQTK